MEVDSCDTSSTSLPPFCGGTELSDTIDDQAEERLLLQPALRAKGSQWGATRPTQGGRDRDESAEVEREAASTRRTAVSSAPSIASSGMPMGRPRQARPSVASALMSSHPAVAEVRHSHPVQPPRRMVSGISATRILLGGVKLTGLDIRTVQASNAECAYSLRYEATGGCHGETAPMQITVHNGEPCAVFNEWVNIGQATEDADFYVDVLRSRLGGPGEVVGRCVVSLLEASPAGVQQSLKLNSRRWVFYCVVQVQQLPVPSAASTASPSPRRDLPSPHPVHSRLAEGGLADFTSAMSFDPVVHPPHVAYNYLRRQPRVGSEDTSLPPTPAPTNLLTPVREVPSYPTPPGLAQGRQSQRQGVATTPHATPQHGPDDVGPASPVLRDGSAGSRRRVKIPLLKRTVSEAARVETWFWGPKAGNGMPQHALEMCDKKGYVRVDEYRVWVEVVTDEGEEEVLQEMPLADVSNVSAVQTPDGLLFYLLVLACPASPHHSVLCTISMEPASNKFLQACVSHALPVAAGLVDTTSAEELGHMPFSSHASAASTPPICSIPAPHVVSDALYLPSSFPRSRAGSLYSEPVRQVPVPSEAGSQWVSSGSRATDTNTALGHCKALGALEALRTIEDLEAKLADAEQRCSEAERLAADARDAQQVAVSTAVHEARSNLVDERRDLLEQLCSERKERIEMQHRMLEVEAQRAVQVQRTVDYTESESRVDAERLEEQQRWAIERQSLRLQACAQEDRRTAAMRRAVACVASETEQRCEIEQAAAYGLMTAARCSLASISSMCSVRTARHSTLQTELAELQRGSALLHAHLQLAGQQTASVQSVFYVASAESEARLALTQDCMSSLASVLHAEALARPQDTGLRRRGEVGRETPIPTARSSLHCRASSDGNFPAARGKYSPMAPPAPDPVRIPHYADHLPLPLPATRAPAPFMALSSAAAWTGY